ncbi:MAG: hypothetical protein K6G03_11085 [Lachnospiraceae bacterium]|nr:hypothetical protein [Lachnospiraceae bacterium]
MGLADSLVSGIAGNTGNIEKAIIEVIDLRNREVREEPGVQVVAAQGGINAGGGALNAAANGANAAQGAANAAQGAANAAQGAANAAANAAAAAGNKFVDAGMLESVTTGLFNNAITAESLIRNKNTKYFNVQFNPSSLQLRGYSGGFVQKTNFNEANNKNEITYEAADTTIDMSVSLLFDSCDPMDAFLEDKMNFSPTNVGTGMVKTLMKTKGNKELSVQKKVEGFIAALRNKYTRLVTFHWADINYTGVLKNVGVNYTMFNVSGEPIRATVDMALLCAHSKAYPHSLRTWQERYFNAFGFSNESFVKTSQKMGSLLNI